MAKVPVPPKCLECGDEARLVTGRSIYPHRSDLWEMPFWQCRCGAYTGCHKGTQHPKGRPAGKATRDARKSAHAVFDPIWLEAVELDGMTRARARGKAYKWLRDQLGLPGKACHIGEMDRETALRTIEICRALERPK